MAYDLSHQTSYKGTLAEPDRAPSQLDEAYNALRASIELSNMVTNAANRIVGNVPTVGSTAKLDVVPSDGVVGDLVNRAREANRSLSEAQEAIQRVNRAFGL